MSQRIAELEEAAKVLRSHKRHDLARAVSYVLTDEGAQMLYRRSRRGVAQPQPNLPMSVTPKVRDTLKKLAKENGTSLEQIVRNGVDRYLEGTWTPPLPVRSGYGSGTKKVNLNVRLRDDEQQQQLKAKAQEHTDEADIRISASHVALSWLLDEFSLDTNGDPI